MCLTVQLSSCNTPACAPWAVPPSLRSSWLARMSRYADRNEKPLHKDDAVRVVDVGGELESAEGTIHSFYLLRDGKHRARVHLAGGRAVGVRIDKLVKIHADDGPMPVHDGFLGLHAAALSAALALRRGTPKGSGALRR